MIDSLYYRMCVCMFLHANVERVCFFHRRTSPAVVLAGDHKQLPPLVTSIARGLGVSLLERLCADDGATPHAHVAHVYDARYITMLVRNYRSHPAIIAVPSRLFYGNKLEPHAEMTAARSLCAWEGLVTASDSIDGEGGTVRYGGDFPILFHGVRGTNTREASSPSWFNPEEAWAVLEHVQSLIAQPTCVKPQDIGCGHLFSFRCETSQSTGGRHLLLLSLDAGW